MGAYVSFVVFNYSLKMTHVFYNYDSISACFFTVKRVDVHNNYALT